MKYVADKDRNPFNFRDDQETDHAAAELGAGLWGVKHYAPTYVGINKARTETPAKRFQPKHYHRRLAFTDFSSHTRKKQVHSKLSETYYFFITTLLFPTQMDS